MHFAIPYLTINTFGNTKSIATNISKINLLKHSFYLFKNNYSSHINKCHSFLYWSAIISFMFWLSFTDVNIILVFLPPGNMATSFAVYSFSTAFPHYYIDPQTNTITPFPSRNTQHRNYFFLPNMSDGAT